MPEPPPSLLIRPAAPSDMAAVAAIYRREVVEGTATFEIEPPDVTEMAARLQAVTEAGFPCLVAERAAVVAGYAYAGPFRSRPAFRFTVENSVYVGGEHRRSGTGRALLARLIDECAGRGFRQMVAVIGDSGRQQGSIRLHHALGFTLVGTMPGVGWKHGRWLDTLLMQRPLGDGSTAPPSR